MSIREHRIAVKWVDGSFRIVGLLGRGLIAAKAEKDEYITASGSDKIKGLDPGGTIFLTEPFLCPRNAFHTFAEVNPSQSNASVSIDLMLDPGRSVELRVVDPDGKPLDEMTVTSMDRPSWGSQPKVVKAADYLFTTLDPDSPLVVLIHDKTKTLGALLGIRGD